MKLLLFLAAAAPLLAQTCSYSVSPDPAQAINVSPSGSPDSVIRVTTSDGCPWHYSTDSQSWILGPSATATQVSGSSSFTWSAAANLQPAARQGKILIVTNDGARTFTINQPGQVCTLALSPTSAPAGVQGGTGTFQVQTNCAWTAASTQAFITVPPNTAGTLNGAVSYTVAANLCVAPRSGAIRAQAGSSAGPLQQFQINQDGSPDNLTLTPTSLTVPQAASDGRLGVTTGSGCPWSAFSDVSWLQIAGASSGNGNGGLAYHVLANTGPPRSGNIRLGTHLFAVTQQAAPAPAVQLTGIENAASGATGPVSPGEIVSLFGSNMGPAIGVAYQLSPDGRSITSTLAGVEVLFDGVAAPLTFVSGTQINAVVPYFASGKSSTQVQVTFQSAASNTVQVPVQDAAPGIFTLDNSGHGAGAILNFDGSGYSVNTAANPAARGSFVSIYCTGGGATTPASADGAITPGAPPLAQSVTVSIGGLDAKVAYSGGAPSFIAGLTQINAIVPPGVTPGPAVPVVVRIGSWQSQDRVTLAVR
ncbi:MAG: hypothetical protein LAP87_00330 [Acidobacteriia bacterium]|nr:hypothetical protein [Terriglobia bacterium]